MIPPSEKQITYFLSLMGYDPWINQEERRRIIREKLDSHTVGFLIKAAKEQRMDSVEKQLNHLEVYL